MLGWMKEILGKLLDVILALLPLSPFTGVINSIGSFPYLGYINWFLPVHDFIVIGMLWLGAITVYYLYSVVARWIKLIS